MLLVIHICAQFPLLRILTTLNLSNMTTEFGTDISYDLHIKFRVSEVR
jgi:hypothetical protein